MIRLRLAIQLHYQVQPPGGDFVFHLHAAFTPRQRVVSESLHFSQPL
ncbi:MAG: transglutaminase family protein, partial [Curvibacter sp.]